MDKNDDLCDFLKINENEINKFCLEKIEKKRQKAAMFGFISWSVLIVNFCNLF